VSEANCTITLSQVPTDDVEAAVAMFCPAPATPRHGGEPSGASKREHRSSYRCVAGAFSEISYPECCQQRQKTRSCISARCIENFERSLCLAGLRLRSGFVVVGGRWSVVGGSERVRVRWFDPQAILRVLTSKSWNRLLHNWAIELDRNQNGAGRV
jgi:hypothetical protein